MFFAIKNMATSKVVSYFIRKKYLCFTTSTISMKANIHFSHHILQFPCSGQQSKNKSLQPHIDNQGGDRFFKVVKENTKSASYTVVIIGGLSLIAVVCYAIFKELLSPRSPNSVYNKALNRCINDPKVIDALGLPIKAYGEETRRGHRSRVSHTAYTKDGINYMRMKFYIQGLRKQGTVNLEVRDDPNGNWMFRYLFIQLKDMSRTVIILEDNREIENIVYRNSDDVAELIPPGFKL